MDNKAKILVIVEGEKTDIKLMSHLLNVFSISDNHTIISYNTNIYTLYNQMFSDGDPWSKDLLQLLKEHERDTEKKKVFDEKYSDILLIFDLDPQDNLYSAEKIKEMTDFFTESSDMGKLYINYPMVESFYHMKSIPDNDYNTYTASMTELRAKEYKKRVNTENRNHDYSKFAVNKNECSVVISQNINKARLITNDHSNNTYPNLTSILEAQIQNLSQSDSVFVLCTCAFYIVDYNPKFIL